MSKAEPWVGTWRPHKPRGPIAALYGSPGPKYGLPGLTGSSKHDPTKNAAPSFSFGRRHEHRPDNEDSPGPCHLISSNISRVGKDHSPAFSLQSRPKEPNLFQVPGPGKYSPERSEKLVFPSARAFSLSWRRKEFRNIQMPGPASYCLPPLCGHKIATASTSRISSFSGTSGSFYEDRSISPGPAAYNVVDPCVYRQKAPQFSMTGRNLPAGKTTMKPGPGAHYPEQVTFTSAKAPSFSFGLHHSEFLTPIVEDRPK